MNQKLKVIEKKIDAIIMLNQLIVLTFKRMTRYKRAIKELEKELENIKDEAKSIKTEIFHMHEERLESNALYLLNLFGDETKTAVSYKQFRKVVDKKNKQGKNEFLLEKLELEIIQLLNEFRNLRNWSHHVPQSLLNSQINYIRDAQKTPEKVIEVLFTSKEISVSSWGYHEKEWITSLYQTHIEFYEKFSIVFRRMKKDYSKLIGCTSTIVKTEEMIPRPFGYSDISQQSMEINGNKKEDLIKP